MRWTTQFLESVAVGDEVALSLAGHPDARGQIVGEADGNPVVVCGHCQTALPVEDFNMATVIRKGQGHIGAAS